MGSNEIPIERLVSIHEEHAAGVSIPGAQMASTMIDDDIITLGTLDNSSSQSGIPSNSMTSLDHRVSSGESDLLSASYQWWFSPESLEGFMTNYEAIPP